MAKVTSKQLSERMSKRLANFDLSDATIKTLADRVLIDGLEIARFDPCIHGLCVEYHTGKWPSPKGLTPDLGISRWEMFPYGIIDWDHFRVRVTFDVDELQGQVAMRGFHN